MFHLDINLVASDTPESAVYYAMNNYPISELFLAINIVSSLIGFTVIFLNFLVFSTMIKQVNTKITNYIIANMAISDFLNGISVIHTVVYNLVNFQDLNECLTRIGVVHCFFHSSVAHLLLLTVTRYMKIIYPFRYKRVIKKKTIFATSAVIWLVSFVYGMLPVLGMHNKLTAGEDPCRYIKTLSRNYLVLTVAVVLYPMCCMNLMYIQIIYVAKRHHRSIASLQVSDFKQRTNWRFTKTIIVICSAYIVCSLPLAITITLYLNGVFDNMTDNEVSTILMYAMFIATINSLVNPIIYALKMPVVNRRFRKIFCKQLCLDFCPSGLQGAELTETSMGEKSGRVKPTKILTVPELQNDDSSSQFRSYDTSISTAPDRTTDEILD